MSELTERLRKMASIETSALYSQRKCLNEAADALEAQEARIAKALEALRLVDGELNDHGYSTIGTLRATIFTAIKALTPSLPK